MKAVLLREFGRPDVMYIGSIAKPEPGPEQVRVKVKATSVNRPDLVQRQGNYPPPKGDSEVLGLEIAGVVDAIGPGVHHYKVGDRVMGLVGGGGYAEYAVAYAGHLMSIPESMSFAEAACICETYITAYLNIFVIGELKGGDSVLLHGGGGGVNTAAIQLCRALAPDCRIIVTASARKLQRVQDLGANLVVDYTTRDFAEEVRTFTGGSGVDVILDHIGATYLARNLKSLAVGGRLIIIGVMGGAKAELNLAVLMVKRQRIIGSVLRARSVQEKTGIIESFSNDVLPLLSARKIVPLISSTYDLDDVVEAHRAMEASEHFGKIVLTVDRDDVH